MPGELDDEEGVTQRRSGDSPCGGVGVTQGDIRGQRSGDREEDTPDEVE